jgi:hypothetical protein
MWDGLTSPLFNLGIFLFLAWLLFKIEKGTVPRWVKRLAIKWKLVEPELSIAQAFEPRSNPRSITVKK